MYAKGTAITTGPSLLPCLIFFLLLYIHFRLPCYAKIALFSLVLYFCIWLLLSILIPPIIPLDPLLQILLRRGHGDFVVLAGTVQDRTIYTPHLSAEKGHCPAHLLHGAVDVDCRSWEWMSWCLTGEKW